MARVQFDGPGVHALWREKAFQIGGDGLVVLRHRVEARLGVPGGRCGAGRRTARRRWLLFGMRSTLRLLMRDTVGEILQEGVLREFGEAVIGLRAARAGMVGEFSGQRDKVLARIGARAAT